MSQENVDAVRAVYDEWGKGNFRAGRDLFDPLVLLIPQSESPDAGPHLGIDQAKQFMQGWLEPWADLTMAGEEFIEAENSVVVAAHQRGAGRESGAPTTLLHYHVWTFRGRAVTRVEVFRTRSEALEAVDPSE